MEDDETAEEAFKWLVTDNSKAYHEKLHKTLQAQATVKKINEARLAEAKDEKEEKEDDMPQLMGVVNSAMNDLMDFNANNADDKSNQLSLDERVSMLNVDQSLKMSRSTLSTKNNTKLVYATVITNHFVCFC